MVVIVKFIVVIALPAIALLVCKGYAEYVNASVARARGFLALLEHIERKIGGYLTPPSKLGEGFSDKSLEGMMERIASGESFIDAYRQCADPLPPSVNKILEELFCDFGKGEIIVIIIADKILLLLSKKLSVGIKKHDNIEIFSHYFTPHFRVCKED